MRTDGGAAAWVAGSVPGRAGRGRDDRAAPRRRAQHGLPAWRGLHRVSQEDVGLLALRIVVGGIYIAHGARKLGWRSTKGGFKRFRDSIAGRGYRPATLWALSAVLAETIGGLLAVAGLLTPLAGAMLLAQSVTILALVRARGFWVEDMGVEYPLMLGTAALGVALVGPGRLSLDAALGLTYEPWLAPGLVCGALIGAAAGLLTRRPAAA